MLTGRTVLSAGAIALAAVGAAAAPAQLSNEQVTSAVKEIIAQRSRDGVFAFTDARTGEQINLVLDDVRVVRGLPVYGWFPNVVFHDQGEPAKTYALDFLLKQAGNRLELLHVRIHKVPKRDGASWMSITRAPLAWWWLPTLERASAVAPMPAWQVMGAIHLHIAGEERNGAVALSDAAGTPASAEFVDVLQPVGKSKADGRYFACAEFRKLGTEPAFYSAAYWLDAKTKLVTAGSVTAFDNVRSGGSKAATEPHCDIGGVAFDIVD